jgi:hypothetical protein
MVSPQNVSKVITSLQIIPTNGGMQFNQDRL